MRYKKTILTLITSVLIIFLAFIQYKGDSCTQNRYEGYITSMSQVQKYNDYIIMKLLDEQKEWIRGHKNNALELEGSWKSEQEKRGSALLRADESLKKSCSLWDVSFVLIIAFALIFTIWGNISNDKKEKSK